MVAGEIRQPERNIPIALIAGVAMVGALYVLVNAGVQYVLPAAAIAASPRPASDAVALVAGALGASVVSAGMALSMLVTLNGTTMSGGARPFRRGARWLFLLLGRARSPAFPTPSAAIVLQFGLAAIRVAPCWRQFPPALYARHFRRVAFLHDHGQHGVRLSSARTECPPPLQVWGYPVVPCCLFCASAALLYYTFFR